MRYDHTRGDDGSIARQLHLGNGAFDWFGPSSFAQPIAMTAAETTAVEELTQKSKEKQNTSHLCFGLRKMLIKEGGPGGGRSYK